MFSRRDKDVNDAIILPGQDINIKKISHSLREEDLLDSPIEIGRNRIFLTAVVFLFLFITMSVRLFDISLGGDRSYKSYAPRKADNDITKFMLARQDIVDRSGTIIATSLPTVNLYANPKMIFHPDETAKKLVEAIPSLNYDRVYKQLSSKKTFVYIMHNLTPNEQYLVNFIGDPGLSFEQGEKRVYPQGELFAHVVGLTDVDNKGVAGLEKGYEKVLTEEHKKITLSLDAGIQDTTRRVLKEGIDEFSAIGGAAVVMNVDTGEIVSMVSLPDFDPNNFGSSDVDALFNRATLGVYEVGSVFKLFNTALALESGKIKVTDTFDASEPIKLAKFTVTDYHGENRVLTVPEILVYSSNIGSAKMALEVGPDAQKVFLSKLGLLNEVPFDIPELGRPLTPAVWQKIAAATVSYGYGVAVTPLHVVTAVSALVNGGVYRTPTIIKRDVVPEGDRVLSKENSALMREMMRMVVVNGSGRNADVVGYNVGGKTGTAEKLSQHGRYVERKVRTSFAGAFPMDDPQYAIMVMLDEPKATSKTYGFNTSGWNAVPTAGKIIKAIAPQLNLRPRERTYEETEQSLIPVGLFN